MDEIVELPLSNPPIVGYLHHAFPLSIMSASESYLPWLHSNYIQLYCAKEFVDLICPLNFHLYQHYQNYPLLDIGILDRTIVDSVANVDIVEFIKNSIDNDYHVLTYIDEFYIKDSNSYQNRHLTHDLLISGYCKSEKQLICSTYFNRKFGKGRISFDDFQKAYYQTDFSAASYTKGIKLIKCNTEEFDFNFDLVITSINDFILRKNSLYNTFFYNTNRLAYGLDVYKYVVNHFQSVLEKGTRYDLRPVHIIWEHKKSMVSRIEYFLKNGIIKNESLYAEYKALEQITDTIRLSLMKYEISKKSDLLEHIITLLKSLESEEEVVMTKLLEELMKFQGTFPEPKWVIK